MNVSRNAQRGFTLTEIAVAVAILALLLGGLLMPLSAQFEAAKVREAQRQIETARDAIIGFALANGRLPCPARPGDVSGAVGAGVELYDTLTTSVPNPPAGPAAPLGQCHPETLSAVPGGDPPATPGSPPAPPVHSPRIAFGVLPWATLGLPETDPWGRRLTYVVDNSYADKSSANRSSPGSVECSPLPGPPTSFCADNAQPPAGIQVAPLVTPEPGLEIRTRTVSGTAATQAQSVVAFVVSHGRNGRLGYTTSGTVIPGDINSDEATNSVDFLAGGPPSWRGRKLAFDRPLLRSNAACNDNLVGQPLCEFDDQVLWISRSLLIGRMAAAGRL